MDIGSACKMSAGSLRHEGSTHGPLQALSRKYSWISESSLRHQPAVRQVDMRRHPFNPCSWPIARIHEPGARISIIASVDVITADVARFSLRSRLIYLKPAYWSLKGVIAPEGRMLHVRLLIGIVCQLQPRENSRHLDRSRIKPSLSGCCW